MIAGGRGVKNLSDDELERLPAFLPEFLSSVKAGGNATHAAKSTDLAAFESVLRQPGSNTFVLRYEGTLFYVVFVLEPGP